MERQAPTIARWGDNVYVKIPVTEHRGRAVARPRRANLAAAGVQRQRHRGVDGRAGRRILDAVAERRAERTSRCSPGRIADTGRDPIPIMREALDVHGATCRDVELIWASPRELLNVVQADDDRLPHHHGHARPAEEAGARSARTSTSSRSRRSRCSDATLSPLATRSESLGTPDSSPTTASARLETVRSSADDDLATGAAEHSRDSSGGPRPLRRRRSSRDVASNSRVPSGR